MFKQGKIVAVVALAVSLSACSWVSRKVPVQQGNIYTQAMVNQLKPGMSKAQVEHIMGEPTLQNTFSPDRVDYVYSFHQGKHHKSSHITLWFKQGRLERIEGDLVPEYQS